MYLINMYLKKDVYPISSCHYYKTVKMNVKIKKWNGCLMKKWEIKLMFAVFYQRFESRDIDLLHWRGNGLDSRN